MDRENLYFYNKLQEEKRQVQASLDRISKQNKESMENYHNDSSRYDNHPADIGIEVYMMEQDKGKENHLKNILWEIDESLENLRKGKYGLCKTCDQPIDKERLELIPYLKTCVECSKELDGDISFRYTSERKIADDFFGTIKRRHVYYDGEDTLQEVFQYNIVENDPSSSTGDNMGLMDEDMDGVEEVENISQDYYDDTLK